MRLRTLGGRLPRNLGQPGEQSGNHYSKTRQPGPGYGNRPRNPQRPGHHEAEIRPGVDGVRGSNPLASTTVSYFTCMALSERKQMMGTTPEVRLKGGGISDCSARLSEVCARCLVVLLLGILLALAMTACGAPTAPDTPANQRYWHDLDGFAVLHWDAPPGAEYYKIYYGDCSKEYPCTLLGESHSNTAAVFISEDLYRDCTRENPCSTASEISEIRSNKAAGFDHNLYVVACNGSACSDDITHSGCDRRGEAYGLSCSQISPNDTADPAQRLMSPDGTTPPTPMDFEGKKNIRTNGFFDTAADDASVTWDQVDGATWYELWIGSGPSSDFRLGREVKVLDYRWFPDEDWKDYLLNRLDIPVNRGSWGEYATTSWKVRSCTMAGCSPFSETITVD